ncbi:hypothetical protein NMY3_01167 [Candidatus Nitrosocosmicus oleophilus]|uniref:Uncharacterized protein n=1 Tax=Candidatus Nitrosocosmicus oleophilus TaxID=1353260 RepID=A0A654M756_9ARCH|nr:hypothetical protein NMY3_01167 [Candidatus Nitrosocosmicus oleophilus]
MTRCQFCHQGLNSNYIRVGAKESFRKIGLYCTTCDVYYSPNLTKQYTVMQKQYTNQFTQNPSNNQNQTGPMGFRTISVLYDGFKF